MPRGLTHLENLELTYITGTMLDDVEPKFGGLVKTFINQAQGASLLIGDAVIYGANPGEVTKGQAGVKIGIVVGGKSYYNQTNEIYGTDAREVGAVAALGGEWVKVMIHGIANAVSDGALAVLYGAVLTIVGAAAAGQVVTGAAVAGEPCFNAIDVCNQNVNGVIRVLIQ